jgi:hypothetical protein
MPAAVFDARTNAPGSKEVREAAPVDPAVIPRPEVPPALE